jgi:hypothetical protein
MSLVSCDLPFQGCCGALPMDMNNACQIRPCYAVSMMTVSYSLLRVSGPKHRDHAPSFVRKRFSSRSSLRKVLSLRKVRE